MKAIIKQVNGCSFIGKADSTHWVPIDTSKENLGSGAGNSPMELILLALAGCSGMDVVSILDKKRVVFDGFEINVDAERSDAHPQVFTRIHLEYVFYGKEIKEEHAKRAIELSLEKYCPVHAMLKNSVKFSSSYKIIF